MSISYEGPPQYMLHHSATVVGTTANASSLTFNTLIAGNDTGVFVIPLGYNGTSYLNQKGNDGKPYWYGDTPVRACSVNQQIGQTSSVITGGLLNMSTNKSCYQIKIGHSETVHIGGNPVAIIGIDIVHDMMVYGNRIAPTLEGDSGIIAYIGDPVGDSRKATFKAERTEFGWRSELSSHHTGVSGFTIYSQAGLNGGIRLPSSYGPFETYSLYQKANNNATKSLIFCRIIPTDGYLNGLFTNGWPNTSQCENAFVVFDGLCDFVLGNSSDSSSIGEPITKLVPSFDADQIKSNTGMLAVAMMAKGASKAYYLGYKNGVYKLYNGSQPYIMPPGSVVNIGKIKFQSIAYSSYFVRMN